MEINLIAITAISLRLNGYCENAEEFSPNVPYHKIHCNSTGKVPHPCFSDHNDAYDCCQIPGSFDGCQLTFDTLLHKDEDSTCLCVSTATLKVLGSEQALRRFKGIIDRGLGGFYTASIGTDGIVTLIPTENNGTLDKQQKAFFTALSKATSGGDLVSLKIYDHSDKESRKIAIGELKSHSLDVQDMEMLGMGGWLTEQGALIHEVYENYLVQTNGQADNREIAKAHVHSTGIENLVNNSDTSPFDRKIEGGSLFVPVRTNPADADYNHKVELIMKKGNIVTVIGNERDENTSENPILALQHGRN